MSDFFTRYPIKTETNKTSDKITDVKTNISFLRMENFTDDRRSFSVFNIFPINYGFPNYKIYGTYNAVFSCKTVLTVGKRGGIYFK